ncbi:hypothetical protein V5O48_013167, partial [Marasmius crinis-equi]
MHGSLVSAKSADRIMMPVSMVNLGVLKATRSVSVEDTERMDVGPSTSASGGMSLRKASSLE